MDGLIADVYEAALRPEMWRTTLHKAANIFGAEGASLLSSPPSEAAIFWSEGLDGLAEAFVQGNWHLNNLRMERGLNLRHTKPVLTESDLFTPEELDRLPYNAEFINRSGFRWMAGSVIHEAPDSFTVFTLERKTKTDRFEAGEIEALEACLPHLRRSADIAVRLGASVGDGMLNAFEELGCAAILLDHAGKVQRVNRRAQAYIGSEITISKGLLSTAHIEANAALERLTGVLLAPHTADQLAQITVAIPRATGRPLLAYGIPILRSARDVFLRCTAILVIVDPDEHLAPSELFLRQIFKLTPAEIRLALALASGSSLNEFAEKQGVTIGTARIQLKAVMAKTSTRRQAELVSILAQLSRTRHR